MQKLDVIFRSCSRVHAVHGRDRALGFSKSELVVLCFHSLLNSLSQLRNIPLQLTLIDDHSESETVERLKSLAAESQIPFQLIQLQETTGVSASMNASFHFGKDNAPDWIYFVEDDYLHAPSALTEMVSSAEKFSKNLGQPAVIHPCDQPERYTSIYPSRIVLGDSRHWRTIEHTTATFLVHKETLARYWRYFDAFNNYGPENKHISEDNTVNIIYREVPCFSPLPSLAIHMQSQQLISPFVDWKNWIQG